jgi:hypothetical protein
MFRARLGVLSGANATRLEGQIEADAVVLPPVDRPEAEDVRLVRRHHDPVALAGFD